MLAGCATAFYGLFALWWAIPNWRGTYIDAGPIHIVAWIFGLVAVMAGVAGIFGGAAVTRRAGRPKHS